MKYQTIYDILNIIIYKICKHELNYINKIDIYKYKNNDEIKNINPIIYNILEKKITDNYLLDKMNLINFKITLKNISILFNDIDNHENHDYNLVLKYFVLHILLKKYAKIQEIFIQKYINLVKKKLTKIKYIESLVLNIIESDNILINSYNTLSLNNDYLLFYKEYPIKNFKKTISIIKNIKKNTIYYKNIVFNFENQKKINNLRDYNKIVIKYIECIEKYNMVNLFFRKLYIFKEIHANDLSNNNFDKEMLKLSLLINEYVIFIDLKINSSIKKIENIYLDVIQQKK